MPITGQVCFSLTRVLVPESRTQELADAYIGAVRGVKVGDPMDPATQMGPLAMQRQLTRVQGYIAKGKEEGAKLALGGGRPKGFDRGWFVEPTVFTDVKQSMTIAREEIFGPVLAAIEFADLDEAIARANDSSYGLAAAVWTRDIKKAHYVARRLQAGTVWINTYNVYDTAAPFGGYKQSGFGREMSMHALEHYTQVKSVWVDLNT
jgi:acyl-CoA reductase-like NAD-dependent aldehyde dehydrogenase